MSFVSENKVKLWLDVCNLRSFIKKRGEWHIEWQRAAQQVAMSDNEWQQVVQQVTTNNNEWQRITMSGYFGQFFIFFREYSTNSHPKENPLRLEENFEEDLLN